VKAEHFTVTDAVGTIDYILDGIDWVAVHQSTGIYGCGSTQGSAREHLIEVLHEFADAIDASPKISDGLTAMRESIRSALSALESQDAT
jgi:hypothetical protein